MGQVTQIFSQLDCGDPSSADQLLPLIYDELRRLAAQRLSREPAGQTLQATALVHEAYVRLVDAEHQQKWDTRGHFFAAAAEAMRRILIERARHKQSLKRGGDRQQIDLGILCPASNETADRLLAINEAFTRLEDQHPESARLVKLRYFAGVPLKDAAPLLGISLATAKRRWTFARAFLYGELGE